VEDEIASQVGHKEEAKDHLLLAVGGHTARARTSKTPPDGEANEEAYDDGRWQIEAEYCHTGLVRTVLLIGGDSRSISTQLCPISRHRDHHVRLSHPKWNRQSEKDGKGGRKEDEERSNPATFSHRNDGGVEAIDLEGGVGGGGNRGVGGPAEHVEGEACQVKHEAGHQDCVQGGEDSAHQVQAGGGGQTSLLFTAIS